MQFSIDPATSTSPSMRKSLLGSFKDKLSFKSSNDSRKDTTAPRNIAVPAQNMASPSTNPNSNNPFSNPSPPTRRPVPTEAPPAYSETANVPSIGVRSPSPAPSHISAASLSTPEDPYAFLSTFDTLFVIDDSGSMAGRSWREVRDVLRAIAPICTAHDADGIDIFFLNHKSNSPALAGKGSAAGGYRGVVDAVAVESLFSSVRPGGGTPTGTRLHNILKPYLALCTEKRDNIESIKPVNIIVITDGVPSDDVESVLVSAAKKLDKLEAPPFQVGVQFFQVGKEPGAREALQELDDGLSDLVEGGIRDMVDTVSWSNRNGGSMGLTADGILKTVLGAVVKRLDRRSVTGEARRQHLMP